MTKGIAEAETAMSGYAREHRFLAVMANYASATGGYPMAGRSAIWDEFGTLIAQAGATGESLVLAKATLNGWTGLLVGVGGTSNVANFSPVQTEFPHEQRVRASLAAT